MDKMPFRSKSQRRKFYQMAKANEIPMSEVKEWEAETGDRELPERVARKRPKYIKRK